jgi:transcriptional regulator with XRE-family HTH domain
MLGKNLATERKKRSMTIKAFAQFLGISPSTLFSWENGAMIRDLARLQLISTKLGFSIEELLLGKESARHF